VFGDLIDEHRPEWLWNVVTHVIDQQKSRIRYQLGGVLATTHVEQCVI
jgi:hypothetical protein